METRPRTGRTPSDHLDQKRCPPTLRELSAEVTRTRTGRRDSSYRPCVVLSFSFESFWPGETQDIDCTGALPIRRAHRASGLLRRSRSHLLRREHLRQERAVVTASRIRIAPLELRNRRSSCSAAPKKVGRNIGALSQTLLRNHGQVAVRKILGVLALAKKYGVASTDNACAMALETGACEYRFVAPLSGTQSATAAELAAGRSAVR